MEGCRWVGLSFLSSLLGGLGRGATLTGSLQSHIDTYTSICWYAWANPERATKSICERTEATLLSRPDCRPLAILLVNYRRREHKTSQ